MPGLRIRNQEIPASKASKRSSAPTAQVSQLPVYERIFLAVHNAISFPDTRVPRKTIKLLSKAARQPPRMARLMPRANHYYSDPVSSARLIVLRRSRLRSFSVGSSGVVMRHPLQVSNIALPIRQLFIQRGFQQAVRLRVDPTKVNPIPIKPSRQKIDSPASIRTFARIGVSWRFRCVPFLLVWLQLVASFRRAWATVSKLRTILEEPSMASQPVPKPDKQPGPHASPYCSDPHCTYCKTLRAVQEAIRVHEPIPKTE